MGNHLPLVLALGAVVAALQDMRNVPWVLLVLAAVVAMWQNTINSKWLAGKRKLGR